MTYAIRVQICVPIVIGISGASILCVIVIGIIAFLIGSNNGARSKKHKFELKENKDKQHLGKMREQVNVDNKAKVESQDSRTKHRKQKIDNLNLQENSNTKKLNRRSKIEEFDLLRSQERRISESKEGSGRKSLELPSTQKDKHNLEAKSNKESDSKHLELTQEVLVKEGIERLNKSVSD